MLELLASMLSVAAGIVLGTLLTWAITYLVMRKFIGRFIRLITNEPELQRILKDIINHITESLAPGKHAMPYQPQTEQAKDVRDKALP